jgi:hypothetical protein
VDSEEDRRKMGGSGRERALARFTREQMALRVVKVYREIVAIDGRPEPMAL